MKKQEDFVMLERSRDICEDLAKKDENLNKFLSNKRRCGCYGALFAHCKNTHKFAWDFIVLHIAGGVDFHELDRIFGISKEELYELRCLVKRKILNVVGVKEYA